MTDLVNRHIAILEDILQNGLDPVYDDFKDFLFDFWPKFAWDIPERIKEVEELLASPDWMFMAGRVKTERGFDFREELNECLREDKEATA